MSPVPPPLPAEIENAIGAHAAAWRDHALELGERNARAKNDAYNFLVDAIQKDRKELRQKYYNAFIAWRDLRGQMQRFIAFIGEGHVAFPKTLSELSEAVALFEAAEEDVGRPAAPESP